MQNKVLKRNLKWGNWMEKNFVINRQLLGWFFSHDKWLRELLIGSLILMVPIINMFIAYGYWLQIMRNSMRNEDVLPDWTGWKEKFILSIQGMILSFTYSFLCLLVFAGLGLVILLPVSFLSKDAALTGLGVLYFIFCFTISFVVMIAIAHFIKQDNLGAGFDIKAVLNITRRCILKMLLLALTVFACVLGPIILIFIVFVMLAAVFPRPGLENVITVVLYLILIPVILWSNATFHYGLGKIYLDAVGAPPAVNSVPPLLE